MTSTVKITAHPAHPMHSVVVTKHDDKAQPPSDRAQVYVVQAGAELEPHISGSEGLTIAESTTAIILPVEPHPG